MRILILGSHLRTNYDGPLKEAQSKELLNNTYGPKYREEKLTGKINRSQIECGSGFTVRSTEYSMLLQHYICRKEYH